MHIIIMVNGSEAVKLEDLLQAPESPPYSIENPTIKI